jgi:hypothetical protein
MDEIHAALLQAPLAFRQEQDQHLCELLPEVQGPHFLPRTAAVQRGSVTTATGIHTANKGACSNDKSLATFYLPLHPEARFCVDGRLFHSRTGESAVLILGRADR